MVTEENKEWCSTTRGVQQGMRGGGCADLIGWHYNTPEKYAEIPQIPQIPSPSFYSIHRARKRERERERENAAASLRAVRCKPSSAAQTCNITKRHADEYTTCTGLIGI
jgi:hypothetical protein